MGACSQQLWLMFCFQRTIFKKWYKFKFWSGGSKQRNLTLIKLYSFWVPWACSALASSRWKPMFLTPYSATLYCNEYSILEGSCFWLVFLDVAKTLSFDFFVLLLKNKWIYLFVWNMEAPYFFWNLYDQLNAIYLQIRYFKFPEWIFQFLSFHFMRCIADLLI